MKNTYSYVKEVDGKDKVMSTWRVEKRDFNYVVLDRIDGKGKLALTDEEFRLAVEGFVGTVGDKYKLV